MELFAKVMVAILVGNVLLQLGLNVAVLHALHEVQYTAISIKNPYKKLFTIMQVAETIDERPWYRDLLFVATVSLVPVFNLVVLFFIFKSSRMQNKARDELLELIKSEM